MGIEHFPEPKEMTIWIENANLVFVSIFIVEVLMKQIAYGPKNYFTNPWNTFDFCIVLVSVFSFVAKDFSAVQGARSLRVLRVLLVLKSAESLKTVITTLVISIP